MKYQIHFTKGELAGQIFPVENDSVSIGRSRSNDIVLSSPDVSRKHIIISNKGRGLFIDNLSSRATWYGSMNLKMGDSVPLAVNIEVAVGQDNCFILESYGEEISDDDKTSISDDDTAMTDLLSENEETGVESVATEPPPAGTLSDNELPDPGDISEISNEPEGDQTEGLKTRMATPEEIQMVKDAEKKKQNLKYILRGVIAAIIVGCLGVYYYFTLYKAPEPNITWPQEKGETSIGYVRIADKNFPFPKDMRLAYPLVKNALVENNPGLLEVSTLVGKYKDVPCWIRLEYQRKLNRLEMNRQEAFDLWMNEKSTGKNSWNFDVASPLQFFSRDNGIPYYRVSYTRNTNLMPVCGIAQFFRYEEWQFALTVEIPANEKWRGASFLNENFVQFSATFRLTHWEGMSFKDQESHSDHLYEAKMLLSRKSASVWPQVEYLLKTTLIRSKKTKNREQYFAARLLLWQLRQNQIKWFNEQKIAYLRAEKFNDENEKQRITSTCKAVFSSPEDLRFYLVRQDNWR